MPLKDTQAIFDSAAILDECRSLVDSVPEPRDEQAVREILQPLLTTVFEAGTAEIKRRFHEKIVATDAMKERSWLVDQLLDVCLQLSCMAIVPEMPKMQAMRGITILAAGGYGRKELFFHSDIDVMVLIEPSRPQSGRSNRILPDWVPSLPVIDPEAAERKEKLEKMASFVLYLLWDLGLKVGHSVRTIEEALRESRNDMTIRTNLLESRFLSGDKTLGALFQEKFRQEIVEGSAKEFVQAKLDEWRSRHEKLGASRYVLEPNIKEGKGGLRDLHTLMWLANYCFDVNRMRDLHKMKRISTEELRDFRKCRKFLYLVRLHLHDISGRPDERLTFDAQREIAERLGYRGKTVNQAVERFMKRYFLTTKTIGRLTRNFYFMLEEEFFPPMLPDFVNRIKLPSGFRLQSGRIHFTDEQVFQQNPVKMIELFWLSHDLDREIHPQAWQWVTRNLGLIDREVRRDPKANRYFVQLLCDERNPELGLRRMNESGVLGKFLPDFGRVVGQMQFDLYHTYTVDEHTIFALGILHRVEIGELAEMFPLSTKVAQQVQLRRALYLGLLCHDIAKGRGGDHSELGEVIARKLGKRFEFSDVEIETAAWLVKEHLLLAMTAFKRDLSDERTIEKFVKRVQSLQRLRLLLLLTVADIRAVGPDIWNSWKGSLLRDLYHKAERAMGQSAGQSVHRPLEIFREMFAQKLPGLKPHVIEAYLDGSEGSFLDAYSPEKHVEFLPLWQEVFEGKSRFALHFSQSDTESLTEMTVVTADRKGLFAEIAGVIAVTGANILHARITTRSDGVAIDRFGIQDMQGNPFSEERRQDRIRERLTKIFDGEFAMKEELLAAEQRYGSVPASFKNTPSVFIDNVASMRFSVVEIECLDRRGLLHDVANTLTKLGLNIASAHITTYGETANDVFYVKDAYGFKLHNPLRRQQVVDRLLRVLRKQQKRRLRKAG